MRKVARLKSKTENNSTWEGVFYQSEWVKINSSYYSFFTCVLFFSGGKPITWSHIRTKSERKLKAISLSKQFQISEMMWNQNVIAMLQKLTLHGIKFLVINRHIRPVGYTQEIRVMKSIYSATVFWFIFNIKDYVYMLRFFNYDYLISINIICSWATV